MCMRMATTGTTTAMNIHMTNIITTTTMMTIITIIMI